MIITVLFYMYNLRFSLYKQMGEAFRLASLSVCLLVCLSVRSHDL